jgi:hypothetical protein
MAAGKENEAPAAPSAAQRHALAVRRCGLKKPGLCRVPLRDITNLVAATELEDPVQVTKLDADAGAGCCCCCRGREGGHILAPEAV